MISLPSLAPQDSYTLWYSSRNCPNPQPICDPDDATWTAKPPQQHRNHAAAYRSPLVQLRFEEESIQHRKSNITDYGAAWLRPPGVPKSLHQLREDEREYKEHQEALRREQLAQELAEAEAGAAAHADLIPGEGEMEEMPDLDDEIPDADLTRADSMSDDDLDADVSSDDEAGLDEGESNYQSSTFTTHNHVSNSNSVFRREALTYDRLLHDNDEILDEQTIPGMLLEEDLVHEPADSEHNNSTTHRNQDIDLDDSIPEAEAYEHTDTEEELSTSEIDEEIGSLDER